MALVVVLQLAGNILLILGSLLLTINPWVYVIFRRLLVTVSTPDTEKRLDIVQRCTGISNLLGFILIILFVITSPDFKQYINIYGVVRFVLVSWSRTIVTTVLFGDVFLRMSITNWKRDGERRNGDQGDRIDMLFESLEGSVKKSAPTKQITFESVPGASSGHNAIPQPVENIAMNSREESHEVEIDHNLISARALVCDQDCDDTVTSGRRALDP